MEEHGNEPDGRDPEVGEIVLLHVPGRSHPIQATVTGVTPNESRPPSLNLRILVPGRGTTNLMHIEHVSLGHPFGGWERRD